MSPIVIFSYLRNPIYNFMEKLCLIHDWSGLENKTKLFRMCLGSIESCVWDGFRKISCFAKKYVFWNRIKAVRLFQIWSFIRLESWYFCKELLQVSVNFTSGTQVKNFPNIGRFVNKYYFFYIFMNVLHVLAKSEVDYFHNKYNFQECFAYVLKKWSKVAIFLENWNFCFTRSWMLRLRNFGVDIAFGLGVVMFLDSVAIAPFSGILYICPKYIWDWCFIRFGSCIF